METIPLVYVKNKRIQIEKDRKNISLDDVLENVTKDKDIYFLDVDGIEKNKPNLCTYQKIAEKRNIWVDAGPRVLGDVVDLLMAGANKITIRPHLFPIEEIPSIKDVTENMIYSVVDLLKDEENSFAFSQLFPSIDGLVFFSDRKKIEGDFKKEDLLKSLCTKYKVYVAETDEKNIPYWNKIGGSGVLLDLKTYKNKVN